MPPITRRAAAAAIMLAPVAGRAQRAQYGFNQGGGRIGFSARHLGMFSSDGQFDRFRAELNLDPSAPATARVAATIETSHFSLPWPGMGDMLRGPRYFDVAHHPTARFSGQGTGQMEGGAFTIPGLVRLRGIERPMILRAQVAERRGNSIAFTAACEIRRSDFGMTPDATLISDLITLTVDVSLSV